MKLALALYKYFPHGGLQRDFRKVAERAVDAGHEVSILCRSWEGAPIEGARLLCAPAGGLSNRSKDANFCRWVPDAMLHCGAEVLCAFNRVPGAHAYFAADPCYAASHGGTAARWWQPRRKQFLRFEQAMLSPSAHTHILHLTEQQKAEFQHYYATPDARFTLVPPEIGSRFFAEPDPDETEKLRGRLGIAPGDLMLLHVGSNFALKGVERCLRAVAAMPEPEQERLHLVVAGEGNRQHYIRLGARLGLSPRQMHFVGVQEDIHRWMHAADLLLHPSERESAGMVLVEALAAGLPVIATETCGYAFHVERSGAGAVIPLSQVALSEALGEAVLNPERCREWSAAARTYAGKAQLRGLADAVLQQLEVISGGAHV